MNKKTPEEELAAVQLRHQYTIGLVGSNDDLSLSSQALVKKSRNALQHLALLEKNQLEKMQSEAVLTKQKNEQQKHKNKVQHRSKKIIVSLFIMALVLLGTSVLLYTHQNITGASITETPIPTTEIKTEKVTVNTILIQGKNNFGQNENPTFSITVTTPETNALTGVVTGLFYDTTIGAKVITPSGQEKIVEKELTLTENSADITIEKSREFEAGLYHFIIQT